MTQEKNSLSHGPIQAEACIALESCRPFPPFDLVASVFTPEQFVSFYTNYTSASLTDVLTCCPGLLSQNWHFLPRLQSDTSNINTSSISTTKSEKEEEEKSTPSLAAVDDDVQTAGNFCKHTQQSHYAITVDCKPSKLRRRHSARRKRFHRWRAVKRFFACRGYIGESDSWKSHHRSLPVQDNCCSNVLSTEFLPENYGWIKTSQNLSLPFDQDQKVVTISSNEEQSSQNGDLLTKDSFQ